MLCGNGTCDLGDLAVNKIDLTCFKTKYCRIVLAQFTSFEFLQPFHCIMDRCWLYSRTSDIS